MTEQKFDGKREPAASRPEHGAEAVAGRRGGAANRARGSGRGFAISQAPQPSRRSRGGRGQKRGSVWRAIAAAHCLPLKEWKRIGFRRKP